MAENDTIEKRMRTESKASESESDPSLGSPEFDEITKTHEAKRRKTKGTCTPKLPPLVVEYITSEKVHNCQCFECELDIKASLKKELCEDLGNEFRKSSKQTRKTSS